MQEAIIYARVSTQEQAQSGVSLDTQVERLMSYCAAMNLTPIRVFREEGVSAGKPLHTRPAGAKLLRMLAEGEATHVVAMKLDRLFRSTEDALNQVTNWDHAGITVHFTDMGGQTLNTQSAMGKMMLTLMSSFAEFERNLISERTAAALTHKKNKRQVYNHVPYGFERRGKELHPHPAEQKVLRQIFEWRDSGMSLNKIAVKLNDLGVQSKTGRRWHAATVAHIVNNDLYRGQPPDNLVPYKPTRDKEPAEAKLMGQMTSMVRDWAGGH